MGIKTSYQIFQEVHGGNEDYKDKEWVANDEVHKELDIFMADLLSLERELPILTSKKITALCIKLSNQFTSTKTKR